MRTLSFRSLHQLTEKMSYLQRDYIVRLRLEDASYENFLLLEIAQWDVT
jgi:hypothetical protein